MSNYCVDVGSWVGSESPKNIRVGNLDLWVDFDSASAHVRKVLVDKCAHMGSRLEKRKGGFLCPNHLWSFDQDGTNEALENPDLSSLPFMQEDDLVYISMENEQEILPSSGKHLDGSETLELIAHAAYYLKAQSARVLFDPWIKGNTYWGAWGHFPDYGFDFRSLEGPTHIVITHPHPDHFHPESMEIFDRTVPVYFPPFHSEIIPKVLRRMGFTNLIETSWEERMVLSAEVSFAFLRPNTFWEDAAVLVRVSDWLWLNQNDSGTPLRDSLVPHGIDLLSSTFDDGASGYPLTWGMPEAKRSRILEHSRQQILKSLVERCEQTGAKFFSPFAGWWRHTMIEHADYASQLDHIHLEDLESVFEPIKTKMIPTIPSTRIVLKSMDFSQSSTALAALQSPPTMSVSDRSNLVDESSLATALKEKLELLAQMSFATNCESVLFTVKVTGTFIEIETEFGAHEDTSDLSITVEVEPWVAELIAYGDETVTWNHLDIGYLGKWSRTPDLYPVNFMKLLQLGYVEGFVGRGVNLDEILSLPLANILESNPPVIGRTLSRAGIPCISCKMSRAETLEDAIRIHNIGKRAAQSLAHELAALIPSKI